MRKILFLFAFIFISLNGFAQNNYYIHYQDETLEVPENIHHFEWGQLPESSRLSNGFIAWIQFYQTPSQTIQNEFKSNHIQLIEYIPSSTYLAYFPSNTSIDLLKENMVRAVVPVEGRFKMSQDLKNGNIGEWALQGNKIAVTLQFHAFVDVNFVVNDLATHQIALDQMYKGANILDLMIPDNCLEDLTNLPYVKWVEVIVAPDVKDDTRGRGLHRSSNLDTQGAGRNYTGDGIGVMVRDDGIVGPHIDFQGRIDNSLASGTGQTHGDGVGGIMAGSGNLDPTKRGMAAGSDVYVVNYAANFLDGPTQSLITSGTANITNSSYSNGCNAGYTTITQTVDQQTLNIPSLLHVFSAGNSNGNDCGYGAGSQWGNITGGHKQGKNVIATANVLYNGSLVGSSSRGPAHDGRIKPDIAAHGNGQNSTTENNGYQVFSGTSAAAPGIAGISAQLYEVYADINGSLPPSALIKATLLNTANDYGNVGPDFKFGWGIVNALRAGILIEDGRYLSDEISQGNNNTHSILIPSGTTQVRFMLYWNDAAASPGASPALVNDLDLVVTDPSNGTHLPWVLDSTPDPVNLNLPAVHGEDHLNNMEQVLINNPSPGTYDLDITGFNVPMGPQEYYIVYEVIQENLTLTYPNAGESFVPGEAENIHWDAINTTEPFALEYSTDNGNSWNAITTVSNSITNYLWTVPSVLTGEAKIRITSGAFQDENNGTFSIAPLVSGLTITQVCPGQASFEWDTYTGANSFDLYILGEKYMEVLGNSNGTTVTVPIANTSDPIWYAIVAKNSTEGWKSRRTLAAQHGGGLLNCVLIDDIAVQSINNSPNDFSTLCGAGNNIVSINLKNFGSDPQSNFQVMYEVTGQAPIIETYTDVIDPNEEVTFEFNTPLELTENGNYVLVVASDLNGDENPFNDTQELVFNAYVTLGVLSEAETFEESGVPPAGWIVENPDMEITWEERQDITGVDGNTTKAAYMNNYDYVGIDQNDSLLTDIYDLTNMPNGGSLVFDLAKAQYSAAFSDILYVGVSTDCGENFVLLYGKSGLDLSTLPDYETTPNWAPTSSEHWRTEQIDISAYAGENVIFKFINLNKNGNSTFIDNIFIDGLLSLSTNNIENIVLAPNPADNSFAIHFGSVSTDRAKISIFNYLGQQVAYYDSSDLYGQQTFEIGVSGLANGMYFVKIDAENNSITKKLLVK
jgi:Subtilase family/Secretion system C-terminal sorting domain